MSNGVIIPITYIERKPNSAQYRIVNKGVTVTFLATLLGDAEWSVERICEEYGLTPAEVHAAWAFYYDHQAEIDAYLAKLTDDEFSADDSAKLHHVKARYQARTAQVYPDDELSEE